MKVEHSPPFPREVGNILMHEKERVMVKRIFAFAAVTTALLILPPPRVQANEITVNLEGKGRLEYDLDADNDNEVVITQADLTQLSQKITEYEQDVRKIFLEAFQSKGINFDNNKNPKLQPSGKTWQELTVFNLTQGLRNLPESWCKNVNSSHMHLTVNTTESVADAVSPKDISGTVEYKLLVPKGWRTDDKVIDMTDIYREAMTAWQDPLFQNEHATKTYHIHSTSSTGETHTHPYNYSCSNYASDSSTVDARVFPGGSGCYTIPILHHHYGNESTGGGCYTKCLRHDHVGGTGVSQGGANTCYTQANYHKHSTSSTSATSTSQNAGPTGSQNSSGGCFTQNNSYWQNKGRPCVWVGDGTEIGDSSDPEHNYKDWKKCKYCGDRAWCNAANCHESSCKIHNGSSDCTGKKITKYDLSCGKDQTSVVGWNLTCTKTPGPQKYNYYQSNLPSCGLGDSYTGTDCPDYEDKTMKYACTRSYNCTSLEKWGSGDGCGKTAHQLLSLTVVF